VVDVTHHLDTMKTCADRVRGILRLYEDRVATKRQELLLLLALRRKYHVVELRDDIYLWKSQQRIKEKSKAYVIVLNHKLVSDHN